MYIQMLYRGAFVQPLLQWKSNKYYMLRVGKVIQMNQLDATMIY